MDIEKLIEDLKLRTSRAGDCRSHTDVINIVDAIDTIKNHAVVEIIDKSQINKVLDSMKSLLAYKNKKYGNSALEPIGIFNKSTSESSICTRLDDKLARVKNSSSIAKNDVSDIVGYLVLLCVENGWDNFDEFKD